MATKAATSKASRVYGLMNSVSARCTCPAHGPSVPSLARTHKHHPGCAHDKSVRRGATTNEKGKTDYAFEMAASNIRYGPGVTAEIGWDLKNLKPKKVVVFTDTTVGKLLAAQTVFQSLERAGVPFEIFDKVRVEPTDYSFKEAIAFARRVNPDAYVAVGGSVIDTAKAANLYAHYPDADFLDFVNAPVGKSRVVDRPLAPFFAIPTTAGTGSETTGVAIFDYSPVNAKTGIASRALKPTLGLVDPLNTRTASPYVHASAGLDVLTHSLESYTAIPYNMRSPRPENPNQRPAYQGSNPISDIWSLKALRMCVENLPLVFKDPGNTEAMSQMILAATFAGIGFGNAGVHLCHGMSYPIASSVKEKAMKYKHPGYNVDHSIVPHGISVAVSAPAVFRWTAASNPERHLECAEIFGVDISNVKKADAGLVLSEALKKFLYDLKVPNGISAMGFGKDDINMLVEGTLPQHRVTKLAPKHTGAEELARLFEDTMTIY
ncbi:hypothetical protein SmJEL517_g00646 [Synchytrium microbalum]|uniref:hydroxyacid-oxoacid transhydrogenase n=1 Tax=Synchytrium microbalum TaxID=1806994 RepID=A0A507C771_9FUNG|nr:uncharacterized protein SmJEL517_g00646 [Synchytrium microbalum]TPX37420.1 hypothetical protein SmJEL517_g00646 [Synchytrium microbalum]